MQKPLYHDYYNRTPERASYSDDITVLRELVDTIKNRHGVSQRDQAKALGVGWTTYRDWLNGTAKWPKSAQMVLQSWASSAIEEDTYGVATRCRPRLEPEEEQRLVAALAHIQRLELSVSDWTKEELLEFAELGDADRRFTSAYDLPLFREQVRCSMIDPMDGSPVDFELSEVALKSLCEHLWDEYAGHVMSRLADLLDA